MANVLVVGVDGSADSLGALAAAAELGEESGSELVVVHVRHENWAVAVGDGQIGGGAAEFAATDSLDAIEATTRERSHDVIAARRVHWRFEVASGDPATGLIAAARRYAARAIVVGGRTHGVVGGLIVGSVAQKLVRHSPASVIVVRDGPARRLPIAATA
jgi:nucleotide-binding universal stress UspA family protein